MTARKTARRLFPGPFPRRARGAAVTTTAVAACALLLAGCGGTGAGTSPGHTGHGDGPAAASASASASAERGGHNAADVAFARGMVPHHRQAVDMAGMAASRASAQEVRDLAAAIRKAQDPEIRTLSGWLASWGEPVPAADASGHAGHSGHGDGAAGMMTPQQMDRLARSSGKAFDTAFLELMVEHHRGAVAMARTERAQGSHPPAKALAGEIIASQSAEITEMNRLRGRG
ncbi:DUF305 domain-containing protein [Streptomyces sp. NPDC016309]|uniref:DUF305 domain-containing protein n=1 Tax=Streptomyces sp. NPDC016309 TaxID=3364965 RepID=UPI0036F4CF3E